MSFDAVLCDFDGVLRLHDAQIHARIDQTYGLAPGTVLKTAPSRAPTRAAVLGEITCEEWEDALVTAFAGMPGSTEREDRTPRREY